MDLTNASREELLQIIGDLAATVTRLEAALTAATTRIATLEADLARRSGPPKTPANSSVPPAKGFKRTQRPPPVERGTKPGPPPGHPGTSRRRVPPDIVLYCEPTHCEHCGEPLASVPQRRVGRSQVVDLPPVHPVVVEAWRYAAQCPACGRSTRAPYPLGLEPTRVFGPQIEALLTYLHAHHHVSYQRLRAIGQDVFGLHLSEGAVANALARTAARLAPQVATIREQVRASPVIGSDETSARVNGQTWWQWVFQNPTASYHLIVPRRNGAVVAAFQDEQAAGTWVSDLWLPQLHAQAARHQICLSHQLRELQYVLDAEQSPWAAAFQGLLRAAIHLAHERDAGRWPLDAYATAVAMVEAWCATLLRTPVPGAEASRLWDRFRAHREHLFVFLYDPAVPPTNNASEQALRNSVVHRKVTGGFRSEWGAAAHAAVATVLDTARKRGEDLFAPLYTALGPPLAAGLSGAST